MSDASGQASMAFPGLPSLQDDSDSSSSDDDDDGSSVRQRRAAWQKIVDNIAAEAGELAGRYRVAEVVQGCARQQGV